MSLPEQRVIPALRITQYGRSKSFYLGQLGFELEREHRFEPHFPVFMSVVCDGMRLFLSEHTGDCKVGALVHFIIPDVDTWHQNLVGGNVLITESPNNDLGFLNMTVTDPDGNQLGFMEPPNAKPT